MEHDITPDQLQTTKQWLGSGSINIFGPPYAGKDTQGDGLVELLDAAPLVGGGDILRSSVIPGHVKEIMERGELIPTKDYIEIVLPFLSQAAFEGKPLVLSAVGQWHGEEEGVLKATAESNHALKAVVYISLPETLIWKRWEAHKALGNRGDRRDDAKESLEIRLKEFREKTMDVIGFYRETGILIEIDGDQPPEKVFADIIAGLSELIQKTTRSN